MARRLPIKAKGGKTVLYDIVFDNSFDELPKELEAFEIENKKLCIVTDSNVEKLYAEQIRELLEKKAKKVIVFTFEAGEENKNLDTVKKLYEKLIIEKFDRKDMLLALGGGVTGDLTGFAAATYLRGIDFIQIPTTLLSQVDSSVGGKTGVDFDSYKNMIGAFYMPKLVFTNTSVLSTLPEQQFYSGMGEVLKYGLIKSEGFFSWLVSNLYEIYEKDTDVLEEMIYESCNFKKMIVEKDPTEQGERALLNFGHTIGHAIERQMNFKYYHGECVALGMIAAAHISWKRDLLSTEEFFEIRDMFVAFNLPISITDTDAGQILEATKSDKKMENDKIKFILLKKMGRAFIDKTVTDEEMLEAIKFLIFDEDDNE